MRSLAPLVLVASALPAQGLATFGSGCGSLGTTLNAYGSPSPGGTVELRLDGGAPLAPHVLIVGLSNTQWGVNALPFGIPAAYGFAPGCSLLVSLDFTFAFPVDEEGSGELAIPVGPWTGGSFYLQVAGLPAASPIYLTPAVAMNVAAPTVTSVAGTVTRRGSRAPVADARITLFAPGLSSFFEARSDASGGYTITTIPGGVYRAGAASPGLDYVETELPVAPTGATLDFALDTETHPGRWDIVGDTLPHTLDATDIAYLLPDGRVFYCHDTDDPIVFDPVTGAKSFPIGSGLPQGCMHGTLLEDGKLIAVGGQDGSSPGSFRNAVRWVKSWSSTSGWLREGDLLNPTGRWYPGLARLADGTLLVMGGGTAPNAARTDTCELFDQQTRSWSWTGTMGQAVEFPPAALLYNGKVLRTWGRPQLYDPATGQWRDTGSLRSPNRGWPGHSDHSLVVLTDGRALVVGVRTSLAGVQASMAEAYDPATAQWTALSSPGLRRHQAEVIYLPDGNVLVAGGDKDNQATSVPSRYEIVKWTDLYDPRADTWRRVADMQQFREYHAVTVLVPDGRVLTTGGTRIKFQPGPLSADIEGYSPPYLFRGVRPAIDNLSTITPRHGEAMTFDVFPRTMLTGVVLMGTGVHTHWVEGGVPRRVALPVQQSGTRVSVTLPTSPDTLPVGHYLLFAMVDDIPSVAEIVRVRP